MALLRDTLVVFRRQVKITLRQPQWLVFALVQPVMYLALFGPLLRPLANMRGFPPGDPWRVFVPGLIVQLGIFGVLYAGFGLLDEIRNGVVDRMRVSPVSRTAILMGRVLRDAAAMTFQAVLLTAAAVPFGLRVSPAGIGVALVVVAMLAVAFASLSYALALITKDEDPLIGLLNLVGPPLLLLSGILLPMTFGPSWLQTLARLNPVSHVVDGLRAAFRGDLGSPEVWWGLVAAAATALVAVAFGTHAFNREHP